MINIDDTVLYCVELTWGEKQMHYVRVKKSDIGKFKSIENELKNIVYFGSNKERNLLETFGTDHSTSSRDPFSDVYEIDESDANGFDFRCVETDEDDDYEPEYPDVFLIPEKKKSKLIRINTSS